MKIKDVDNSDSLDIFPLYGNVCFFLFIFNHLSLQNVSM